MPTTPTLSSSALLDLLLATWNAMAFDSLQVGALVYQGCPGLPQHLPRQLLDIYISRYPDRVTCTAHQKRAQELRG